MSAAALLWVYSEEECPVRSMWRGKYASPMAGN